MINLQIKSIDTMKLQKDVITNQMSDAAILNVCQAIVNGFHPTHIAIAIPFDSDTDFRNHGNIPSPRTAEAHYQKWCDTIHNLGVGVLHRGTWSAIENIWNFPYPTGTNFLPQGTAQSAPTDGTTTWLGKTYQFLVNHSSYFKSGDVWAPIPEPTTHAFDGNFFLSNTPSETTNFANFFQDMITISNAAFTGAGLSVKVGYTSNNYSEVNSGWIPGSLFAVSPVVAFDYYGNAQGNNDYSATAYNTDVMSAFNAKSRVPIHWQEWGDLYTQNNNLRFRNDYFQTMLEMMKGLALGNIMTGFSYWGGWDSQNTSLLYKDGNGNYLLNPRGKMLAAYFNGYGMGRPARLDSTGNY